MKRWLVILLIAVAVIVLLSPGIIGKLAEDNIDAGLSRIDLENENIRIESESFRRGWFTSEGRHRIVLGNTGLAGSGEAGAGYPAIIIDTRLDHGLVPVTSMQRERGSLSPALANAISTVQIDRGEDDMVQLPGHIYTFIGLGGDASFRFLLEAGSDRAGNVTTRWEGADIVYTESADGKRRSMVGTIAPGTVFDTMDVVTTFGAVSIDTKIDRRSHRLGDADLALDISSVEVESVDGPPVAIGPVAVDMTQQVDDGRASGTIRTSLIGTGLPDIGDLNMLFDIEFAGLDADSLAVITDIWRDMNDPLTPQSRAELMATYPALELQAKTLAARGGELDIRQVRIAVPNGEWTATLDLDVPETGADAASANWATIALQSSATLNARVSAGLFDELMATNTNLQAMVAGGFLVLRGDGYEIEAAFENGRLTINGAPFPLDMLLGAPR